MNPFRLRQLTILAPLALLVLAIVLWNPAVQVPTMSPPSPLPPRPIHVGDKMPVHYGAVVSQLSAAPATTARQMPSSRELEPETLAMLAERRAWMKEAMKTSPSVALASAVTWSEYQALPEAAKALVEQPLSDVGHLMALPNCTDATKPPQSTRLLVGRREYDAIIAAEQPAVTSKEKLPVSGITLDGMAVLAREAAQIVSTKDADASKLPLGAPQARVDLWTGAPLVKNPVPVLVGGKVFHLNSTQSAQELSRFITKLNAHAGPFSGAQAFLEAAAGTTERAIDQTQIKQHCRPVDLSLCTHHEPDAAHPAGFCGRQ